eukprot:scaffold27650_cov59-Phaeocystis_antarctica.AAC.2
MGSVGGHTQLPSATSHLVRADVRARVRVRVEVRGRVRGRVRASVRARVRPRTCAHRRASCRRRWWPTAPSGCGPSRNRARHGTATSTRYAPGMVVGGKAMCWYAEGNRGGGGGVGVSVGVGRGGGGGDVNGLGAPRLRGEGSRLVDGPCRARRVCARLALSGLRGAPWPPAVETGSQHAGEVACCRAAGKRRWPG